MQLETPRLILRQWRADDFPAYAATTADPEVMQYFPQVLTSEQSNEKAEKMQSLITERGWGFWAVEQKSTGAFIGLTGLHEPNDLPFCPCVEVGWQYAKHAWGKGYATEAAKASLQFAFDKLKLADVVSFTAEINTPSRAVMERIGMQLSREAFPHPAVPDGDPLKQHVLYKINRSSWDARKNEY